MCVFMNSNCKVLVVGTTSDYIDWIRKANPGRALFLTDPENRQMAIEEEPEPAEEILCCLEDAEQAKRQLFDHLNKWRLSVNGISCFDCESMELAAFLAKELSLPYPSGESIRLCRDKYVTKTIWQKEGVGCPRARIVQSAEGVFDFLQEIDGPCVIKPLSGSGSELVFYCKSRKDCNKNTKLIQDGLAARKSHRLHKKANTWFLVEECVHGVEYSCDFIIKSNEIQILRFTRKIKNSNKPFGTIDGYMLVDFETEGISLANLCQTLLQGANSLGIRNAICMVDFLVRGLEILLLEITPRPGGDCIPFLLKRSIPLDILTCTLDFAQQGYLEIPKNSNGKNVALRLHARRSGTIQQIDDHLLQQDSRVLEIHKIRVPGHHVTMPPKDYDSWYLGHLVFKPYSEVELAVQVQDLCKMFIVEIENDGE